MHIIAIYITCFPKHNPAFNVSKKMDKHASVKEQNFFLDFYFFKTDINAILYLVCQVVDFANEFSATACHLNCIHCSKCILTNAWFFLVLMNRTGCHNKLLSSRTDFERKKADSKHVNNSWAFQFTISGDQYHLFKWPCVIPALFLSTFMSTWHFPRNFSKRKAATM